VLQSGTWRLLRAVGTAKVRSAGMWRTVPGWALSRSAGGRTWIRRKVTGRTKTEVREKLRKIRAEAEAGLKISASYTWPRRYSSSRTTETIYRHELRPVITTGADAMDKIFI
jgi:hypothetical protein